MVNLVSGRLSTNKNGDFVDSEGRKLTLKGINIDASSKLPFTPNIPSSFPSANELFWDGENVSFVGRPFPLSEARTHLLRIKSWGFNVIRYIITWEAIEHEGPGKYDDDFIEYTCEVLRIIQDIGGIYVFFDPHQDCWSRFSGGSGAPLWTFYAAGMDPKKFGVCGASILHGDFYDPDDKDHSQQDPEVYAKMLWPTNYYKLGAATMFTLFFNGKMFAPKAMINGVNIQDYLQSHFFDSFQYLLSQIKSKHPEYFDEMIVGIEMMNEPNVGFYGTSDLKKIPRERTLRVGHTPTWYDCLQLGVGRKCVVDNYKITVFGPRKTGTTEIDPMGETVWLSPSSGKSWDTKYQWDRASSWRLGECLWGQHGLWDHVTGEITEPNFFKVDPHTGQELDIDSFTNGPFVEYYINFKEKMRSVQDNIFILLHPVVFGRPPKLVDKPELIDDKIIYALHYYDGLSLMSKTWNKIYNVDTFGIVRGKYSNPIFGLVFGETNIRNCIRSQLREMKSEGKKNLGKSVAAIVTETGMPFDMDGKAAFKDGNYDKQTSALDALGYALEGSDLSHTYWCYCWINSHKWGDSWNCEDFSFYSPDDMNSIEDDNITVSSEEEQKKRRDTESDDAETTSMMAAPVLADATASFQPATRNGVRAANAIIRPYALKIHGTSVEHCEFDMKNQLFKLKIGSAISCFSATECGGPSICTEIYLPKRHFKLENYQEYLDVKLSSGEFVVDVDSEILKWYHGPGKQEIEISNYSGAMGASSTNDFVCSFGNILGWN
ncbi:hydrolase [Saccharomycopsis crataegensis]|uniref:Hydrolase n=1 Tax=Saccharomycopsis crataegensis TaxID=43959 RepID=A0AAV5QSS1_9ASCO|nr:hydrolase [Saccharomycopsis crataegensis]